MKWYLKIFSSGTKINLTLANNVSIGYIPAPSLTALIFFLSGKENWLLVLIPAEMLWLYSQSHLQHWLGADGQLAAIFRAPCMVF